jgi:spore maturation protein CgeB
MATGGFLITNRIKGHTDFFQDGRNIVLYSSEEECIDKIEFYRDKPDLRKKIAILGMKTVLSSFTFKHSFEKMFQHMELI